MKILITGIAGRLNRMVALELQRLGHQLCGIDRRPWPDAPSSIEVHRTDIRKRAAEEVFRHFKPDAVIHMATVTHFTARSRSELYRINLGGTRAVFKYTHKYGVKHTVFVGRHTFYGAAGDAPLYHSEEAPPMAVGSYPELADLIAADLYAGSALWRFPEMTTTVLRMCYTLGPLRHGTLANYLRGPRVPTVLGFDPLFQFMHDTDLVSAVCCALEKKPRGVFNVAGPPPVPLSLLIKVTGRHNIPLPEAIFRRVLGNFGFPKLPQGAVNHIKYPVVIDGSDFTEATGFEHAFSEIQTMESFRWR